MSEGNLAYAYGGLMEAAKGMKEADKFSDHQLKVLKQMYGKIKRVNPDSETYKNIKKSVKSMNSTALKQVVDNDIPWLASIARLQLNKLGLKEGFEEDLYIMLHEGQIITEAKSGTYTEYGKTWKTKVFKTDKEANDFMEKNSDWGVIGEKDGEVHVAKMKDKGKKAVSEGMMDWLKGGNASKSTTNRKGNVLDSQNVAKTLKLGKKGQFAIVKQGNNAFGLYSIMNNGEIVGNFGVVYSMKDALNYYDNNFRKLINSIWIGPGKYVSEAKQLDPVDKTELKGKYKDRDDKDVDNDGDTDPSDKYIHKKRKAITKAIKKDNMKEETLNEESGTWEISYKGSVAKVDARSEKDAINKALNKMKLSTDDKRLLKRGGAMAKKWLKVKKA